MVIILNVDSFTNLNELRYFMQRVNVLHVFQEIEEDVVTHYKEDSRFPWDERVIRYKYVVFYEESRDPVCRRNING
jgi:hypothetical protein